MRIGIAVKPGLTEARDTLVGIEQWLRDHAVFAVWTQEAADLLLEVGNAAHGAVPADNFCPYTMKLLPITGARPRSSSAIDFGCSVISHSSSLR